MLKHPLKPKINNLEEILLSLNFGIATQEDYQIILLHSLPFDTMYNNILSFLRKNYERTILDIKNKKMDPHLEEKIIKKLNEIVIFKNITTFSSYLENCFLYYRNNDPNIIKNNINQYMSSIQKDSKLNDKLIFYLLLINRLLSEPISDLKVFKQIFENKFEEKTIDIMLSKGKKIAKKFGNPFPYNIDNLFIKKQENDSEDSELLLLFILFLCFEEIKRNENKKEVFNRYFKYFLKFDLCKDIYLKFNEIIYIFCQQKSMEKENYIDFFIHFINYNKNSIFRKNKSTKCIFQNFINCIIKIKDNANLSRLDNDKFILFLNPFISFPVNQEDEIMFINFFCSLIIMNQKYRKLIWKHYKDTFNQMLTLNINNSKFLFALKFFIKYYKINLKKDSFYSNYDKLNQIFKHDDNIIECLIVLMYSSKIRNKIKTRSIIEKMFNIILNKSQDINKLKTEIKNFENLSFDKLFIEINADCYLEKGRLLISKGKYDETQNRVSLDSSAYINKVEIKQSDYHIIKELINKYQGLKEIEGNYYMLGVVIFNVEKRIGSTKKEYVFLFNKYNNYWYKVNSKEFVLDFSMNKASKDEIKKISLYFFLKEKKNNYIDVKCKKLDLTQNHNEWISLHYKEHLIWLEYNDIINSFNFLISYYKDNFECFKKLCEYIIETRKEPKIIGKEEKNFLFIIISFHESKKNHTEQTKKVYDIVKK